MVALEGCRCAQTHCGMITTHAASTDPAAVPLGNGAHAPSIHGGYSCTGTATRSLRPATNTISHVAHALAYLRTGGADDRSAPVDPRGALWDTRRSSSARQSRRIRASPRTRTGCPVWRW